MWLLLLNLIIVDMTFCKPSNIDSETKFIYKIPTFDTMPPYGLHEGFREFQGCHYSNCYYTENVQLLPSIQDFHAVLFSVPSFRSNETVENIIPKQRLSSQRYVMVLREAPWPDMSWIHEKFWYNFFNWTWTYREDSDLFNPLAFLVHKNDMLKKAEIERIIGHARPNKLPSIVLEQGLISKKNKLIFWVVSNCHTRSKREDYVRLMMQYIPVDIYGACGSNLTFCSTSHDQNDECFEALAKDYKFYLAFENALCPGYVTEKFFRTLRLPLVPIVMGGDNYRQIQRRSILRTEKVNANYGQCMTR